MTTTIRILVVSDFDLSSASRLADSPLLSSTNRSAHGRRSNISNISSSNINSNSSSDPLRERSIDLCVAINAGRQQQQQQQNGHRRGVCYDPRDELLPYYQGKQKRDRILRTAGESRRCRRTRAGPQTQTATTTPGRNRNGSNDPNYDYDYDHNYNYQYRYNGTVVEQLRGRSRLRAHAYHPDPFGKSNDNINSSASAIAGAIDPPASFRSIPIPVPLPPALQPRFHHDVGDGAVLVEEEAEIELSRGVSDGNGYGNGNGNGGDNAMAFHGHNDSDEDINRPFRNRDRRSGVGGPEEFAARLGLITAALAQLESIVCRVVYLCEDLHPAQRQRQRRDQRQDQRQRQTKTYRRLTSNSLDLAGRWLPLLEGLGIGGILGSEDPSASTTSTDRGDNNNNNNGNGNDEEDVRARCNKNLEAILRSAFPVSPPHGNSGNSDSDNETDGTEPTLFQSIVLNTGASRTVRNESQQQQQQQQHEGQTPTSFSVGYRAASSSSPPSSSAFVRDHCVLEIAAWGAAPVAAPGGADKRLVVPGSLRRNGEFCLIDLVRSEHANGNDNGNDNDNANVKANAQRAASWEVARTQFCRLDDFEP